VEGFTGAWDPINENGDGVGYRVMIGTNIAGKRGVEGYRVASIGFDEGGELIGR
jgi:hypothetical protein